jgi:phage tail-like protein
MAEEHKIPLLQYLPELYQDQAQARKRDFLERFLSVFAHVLEGLERTISELPGYFDPLAAPDRFYTWQANWVSLDLYELLGDKNRDFILKAVEFYKKKGTVSGIADLVTLLTGKKCCVKEYMNNVLRTYGMEHVSPQKSRGISKTVDTSNPVLLAKMGAYDDEVYYITDTGGSDLYSRDVIGLYIFLRKEEKDFIIKENQLRKIIDSFLPVFVRAEIIIVEENYETYEIDKIVDTRKDRVHGVLQETSGKTAGTYINTVTWNLLCTYRGIGKQAGKTNNLQYRTMHDEIGMEKKI